MTNNNIQLDNSLNLKTLKKVEMDTLRKVSSYLRFIQTILSNVKDKRLAQKEIEETWIDLARKSIDITQQFYKNQTNILKDAFDYLEDRLKRPGRKTAHVFKNELVDINYVIISFTYLLMYYKNNSATSIAMKIAESVVYRIWISKKDQFNSFEDFKLKHNVNENLMVKIGFLYIELFAGQFAPNPIFSIELPIDQESATTISLNEEYKKELLESLIVKPHALPMVCKPNNWSNTEFGGNLDNTTVQKSIVTGSSYHGHILKPSDKMFKAINYLNSQEFKVNTDLLQYLYSDGQFLLSHSKEKEPENYLKQLITIQIADTYRNVNFYLNTNIDWRSRIYTNSFYLSYQGSDISLALLSLAKGDVLTSNGLMNLFIYGANCYNENGVAKLPFNKRIEWVEKNMEKILEMSPEFILKAENIYLFAAFCLSVRKYKANPKTKIHMPVFLDATCSGIQHFAAMLMDYDLARDVNLTESNEVKDLYTKMVDPINNAIKLFGEKHINYSHFQDIKLTRKELKRVIMTKTYNVTLFGIADQLKSAAIKDTEILANPKYPDRKIIITKYIFPSRKKNKTVTLTDTEVLKLASIIDGNIFNAYPVLQDIYLYLTSLSTVMIKFGLPITWATPSGLLITQHYKQSETKKVSLTVLGKNKTVVLKSWVRDSLDKRKQVNAIIPNIIHSFDASHLIEIVNAICNNNLYLLPIHDCYGTHPNNMDTIANEVRLQFIKIYSQENFLEKLRDKVIYDLKSHSIDIQIDEDGQDFVEKRINSNKIEKYIIAHPPKLGKYDINELIRAKYMIC